VANPWLTVADGEGYLQVHRRYRDGTVISQSHKAGARVLPDTTITLVAARRIGRLEAVYPPLQWQLLPVCCPRTR
jgi:cyanophycinase-like exopeptidase